MIGESIRAVIMESSCWQFVNTYICICTHVVVYAIRLLTILLICRACDIHVGKVCR